MPEIKNYTMNLSFGRPAGVLMYKLSCAEIHLVRGKHA